MAENTIIKFSRNVHPEHCGDEAIIRLNKMNHIPGQPVLMKYYLEDNTINAILAVGIKSGTGRDSYQIVSTRSVRYVNRVVYDDAPDVGLLVNDERVLVVTSKEVRLYFIRGLVRDYEVVEGPMIYENLSDGTLIFIGPDGKMRLTGDWYSQEEIKEILEDYATKGYVDSEITDRITEIVSGGEIDLKGYVKTVNDIAPDENGNVVVDIPSTDELLPRTEANKTFVKTISVNNGEKQRIDSTGNIDIDSTDPRLTQEYIDYIESKLKYNYTFGVNVSPTDKIINLPTTLTTYTFTATVSVGKSNDMGAKPVSVTSAEVTTAGWVASELSIAKFTKTVDINPKETSVQSGTVNVKITNSDGKEGTASGSASLRFSKPWYVFETSKYIDGVLQPDPTVSELSDYVNSFINNTATPLKTYTRAETSIKISTVGGDRQTVWFAIPNTFSNFDAIQLSNTILSSDKKTVSTAWGNYTIYKSNLDFNSVEKTIEIKMS